MNLKEVKIEVDKSFNTRIVPDFIIECCRKEEATIEEMSPGKYIISTKMIFPYDVFETKILALKSEDGLKLMDFITRTKVA